MNFTAIYAPTVKSVRLDQRASARSLFGDAVAANDATVVVV